MNQKRKRRSFYDLNHPVLREWLDAQQDLGKSLELILPDVIHRFGKGDVIQSFLNQRVDRPTMSVMTETIAFRNDSAFVDTTTTQETDAPMTDVTITPPTDDTLTPLSTETDEAVSSTPKMMSPLTAVSAPSTTTHMNGSNHTPPDIQSFMPKPVQSAPTPPSEPIESTGDKSIDALLRDAQARRNKQTN